MHVLLLITTPWCEGCDALHAEVASLASRWQDESMLRVASFDVGHNDLPRHVRVEQLPCLMLVRPSGTDAVNLSHLRTERELSDALVTHTAGTEAPLRRPVDLDQLSEAIELLPRLQRETQLLLEENARLRAEIAGTRGMPSTPTSASPAEAAANAAPAA